MQMTTRNITQGAINPTLKGWGQLTKQLDVDLLQRVDTAELVQLMVNLVEDESFVIVGGVVLHYVIY